MCMGMLTLSVCTCTHVDIYRYTKEFTLTNTSEIPMRFSWRVPEDNKQQPEFEVRWMHYLPQSTYV